MSAIFVSHSSRDNEISARVKGWLERHGHRSTFLDFDPERGIPPGRDWERELYQRLRACRAVVAVVSEHFTASRWCFAEITQARSLGKKIIPIRVDDSPVDSVLSGLQMIDLAEGADAAARRLAWALEAAGVDAADPFDWDGSRSPYPGFLAFQEEDAAIFFGRDREIGRGLDLLNRARWQGGSGLVTILGASGAGKSSLLRAGLLPRLRRDRRQWIVAGPLIPGREPLQELAGALRRAHPRGSRTGGWQRIHRRLLEGEGAGQLVAVADDLRLSSSRPEARVLLVVDQFEELLGHPAGHPSERFLHLLRGALEQTGGPVMTLATLRSDFLGELQRHRALRGIELEGLPLGPMPVESLAEVIEKPAALAGVEVESGLTSALLHDAEEGAGGERASGESAGGEGALPLVAFTLRELYRRWGAEGRLTAKQYRERLGGLRGAVAEVAASVLTRGPGQQHTGQQHTGQQHVAEQQLGEELRDAFLRMVRVNEEGQYTRASVAWDELPASVRPLLERFVDARLLTSRGEGPSRRLEVAHETLFSAWDTLAGWLEESREALLVRKEVRRAAALWRREDRADEYLWTKGRLQRALDLQDEGRLPLDAAERAFLTRSREVEEGARRRRRRLVRAVVAGVGVAALVMGALAVVALASRATALREKRAAEVRAAEALAIHARTAGYPLDQALLLAVESGRRLQELDATDLFEPRTALANLLLAEPALDSVLHGHGDWVWAIDVSPEGRRMASGGSDGRMLLWDLEQRRPLWNLDPCAEQPRPAAGGGEVCSERVRSVAFSPDGALLATGTRSGKILLWDAHSGGLSHRLAADDSVVALAFGADGTTLVSADESGALLRWRGPGSGRADDDGPWTSTPQRIGRQEEWFSTLALLPGGDAVVSAGADRAVRLHPLRGAAGNRILHSGDDAVFAVATGATGLIAAGFGDGTLRIWDGEGRLVREAVVHTGEIRSLDFSQDGSRLASGSPYDGTAKVWNALSGELAAELGSHRQGVTAVAFDRSGGHRLVTGARNGKLRVWDLRRSGFRLKASDHDSRLVRVDFQDRLAATGALDGTVRLIRLRDWSEAEPAPRQPGEVWGAAVSPDGQHLITSAGASEVRLWDVASGTRVFERADHRSWVWGADFSPGGDLVATCDERGRVILWNVPSGIPRLLLRPAPGEADVAVKTVAFDATGTLLATGSRDGQADLWDPRSGRRLRSWHEQTKEISDLSFSRDGMRLAVASLDGSVLVWPLDREAGPELILSQAPVAINTVALGPDDRWIATGDAEGVIRVWDRRSGEPHFALLGHDGGVLELTFDGPGSIVSAGADRTFRRWDLGVVASLDTAYERACALANRNLDAGEWDRHFNTPPQRLTCPDRPSAPSRRRAPAPAPG